MRISSLLVLGALVASFVPVSQVFAVSAVAESGELIRSESSPAVYYMGKDGYRYVFPNDRVFVSWYATANGEADFSAVKTISDADLATIHIGGNVTYHPGYRMVKIQSDAKTYLVTQGGTLRWVSSESIASALYGSDWNKKIDDVSDAFFSNYKIGAPINDLLADTANGSLEASHQFGGVVSIAADKGMVDYLLVPIQDMAFGNQAGSTFTISAGQTVKFVNLDGTKHTASADDSSWGTGTLNPDSSYVVRFDQPGTYTFHCDYHLQMTGTIVVE